MRLLRRRLSCRISCRINRHDRDRGAAILEFAGFLPVLLLVAMACIQLGIVGYAASQAGTAARAAARTQAQEELYGQGEATGKAAMSDWLAEGTDIDLINGDSLTATAKVSIPSVVPGIDNFGEVERSVTMPADQEEP
ncbi:pilus assembly protein [Streptomyces sp. ISL-96]|uniref:TadE family protein n=1 Tax=Streptomyces sp. ISL-96 TaxID=2819191 RepID=UPI001BE9B424|nr:TadE family protein [Streptomyces sp. ISL-96]MBT2492582.1 pilus assembly protein [Streptomyces sp. ISL-96]